MKKISKIILTIVLVVVVAGATAWFAFLKKPKQPEYTYITANKDVLTQEVSITGRIRPTQSVDLSFESAGRVSGVYADIGNTISMGQTLVALNSSELNSELAKYQAQLEAEQVELTKLKKGTRQEEIDITQTTVNNAEKEVTEAEINLENVQNTANTNLNNLYDEVSDLLYDAYTTADDAVTKQTNEIFDDDSTDSPSLTFSTSDSQSRTDAEWQRVLSRDALSDLKTIIDNLSSEHTLQEQALTNAENYLVIIRDFLNRLNDSLNASIHTSATTINTYKGYVNTARANVIAEITSINSQQQLISAQKATNQQNISTAQSKITTAQNTLDSAKKQLTLKQAGSTIEQIQAQEAKIRQSEANIKNTESKIAKNILYSPISGIVTAQEAKVGEIVSVNTIIVSVISDSDFKIEANVPEIDITKVKLGDTAKLTLDAYSTETPFEAEITAIDPAETIIEGVATYKVTLKFTEKDDRVKPGMTADVNILTAQKENVISIPARAVITQNGRKFVRILRTENGILAVEETTVKIGLRGSNGNVEILQGVKEGDKVITLFEE